MEKGVVSMIVSAPTVPVAVPVQVPQQDMKPDGFFISEQERKAIIEALNASNEPKTLEKSTPFPDGPLKGQKPSFKAFKDDKGNIIVVHDKAVLGKGAFGNVLVAQVLYSPNEQMKPGDFCAVKIQQLRNAKAATKVKNEDEISRELGLNHSGFLTGSTYYFVMPLFVGEPISKAVPSYVGKMKANETPEPFSNPDDFNVAYFISLFQRMTDAMDKVHKAGILHLDIKPDNMIENPESGEIQLIDCGESRRRADKLPSPQTNAVGTPAYIAAEFFDDKFNDSLSTKQDISSLARVFELVMYADMLKLNQASYVTRAPHPSVDGFPLYQSSYLKDQHLPNQNNSPVIEAVNELIDLIHQMRNSAPNQRPEATDIKARLNAISAKYQAAVKAAPSSAKPSEMGEVTQFVESLFKDLKDSRDTQKRQQMKRITPMYQQHSNSEELTQIRQLIYDIDQLRASLQANRHYDAAAVYSKVANLVTKYADANGHHTAKLCDKIVKDIQQRTTTPEQGSKPNVRK